MKYRISSDDVVFEDFDGEMVVLDLGTGRYFGLNASASALWAALSGGVETASLAAAGAPAGWIAGFAAEAVQAGLLVEAPDAPETPLPAGFRLPTDAAPSLEAHSELSDLIAADPIHDVDLQAGWPHLPPDQVDR